MSAPIFHHPQSLKIFGPAGSGKSRELVNILSEHIADGDFHLLEGIIVSFTRAAAYDIARRVNPDGEPGRYHCTLHALCKRYYGFEGNIADGRLREFFKEVGIPYAGSYVGDGEEWSPTQEWKPSEGGLMMSFFSKCRNLLISIEEGLALWEPPAELLNWWSVENMGWVWDRYCDWKTEHGLIEFTDMLEHAANNPPNANWAFFVLDEAQDSTPLQWMVAQSFASRAEVAYIAGDDDQAIYSWAGANPHEFLAAATSDEDVLRVNYRSSKLIVDSAQAFIRRNVDRKDKGTRAARQGGVIGKGGIDIPDLSIDESTMIMGRAHYLLADAQRQLTERGFPFVDKRRSNGVSGKAAAEFGRMHRLMSGQPVTLDEWRQLMGAIPSNGPWLMRGAKARISEMDAAMRKSSLVRARDLIHHGATDNLVNALLARSFDPMARVDRKQLDYFSLVAERYGSEYLAEAKAGAVCSVGPIHAFKGLECDHAIIHEALSPAAAKESRIDPEPERRVFYVAMTRAKERITWINNAFANTNYREIL